MTPENPSAPLEIERKFLVLTPPDLTDARRFDLMQGYITTPDDSIEVRLRREGMRCVLCVKSGEGVVRTEREIELDGAQFETLWPETLGRRVEKTRWTGQLNDGWIYELDVYAGALAPLLTVEVEFPSQAAAAAFQPPEWFGRDVSFDNRFRNKSLALRGAELVKHLFS